MRLRMAGLGQGGGTLRFLGPYPQGGRSGFRESGRAVSVEAPGLVRYDAGYEVADNAGGSNAGARRRAGTACVLQNQLVSAYLLPRPANHLVAGSPNVPPAISERGYNVAQISGDDVRDVDTITADRVIVHASSLTLGNLSSPLSQQSTVTLPLQMREEQIQALVVTTADPGSECYLQDFDLAGRLDQIRGPDNLRDGTSIQLSRQLRVDLTELRDDYNPDTDPVSYLVALWDGRIEDSLELALPAEAQAPPATMEDLEARRQQRAAASLERLQAGGETERVVKSVQRLEQGDLRILVCGPLPSDQVTCVLCGRVVPNRGAYIWAAHIKKRTEAEAHELLDVNIGAAMCKVAGCDSLYEEGDVIVDENGVIRANEKQSNDNPAIRDAMAALDGRDCTNFNADNAQYYSWHRERHTAP